MAIETRFWPSLGYELSFGNSLAKCSRDGRKVFYVWKKSEQFDLLHFNYFILNICSLTAIANYIKCQKNDP